MFGKIHIFRSMKIATLASVCLFAATHAQAQTPPAIQTPPTLRPPSTSPAASTPQPWNGKSCAVVLTYDDAIDIDLDNVVPALDSLLLKATFYIIGASPVVAKRLDEWRRIAAEGHELGNHALFHPCDGSLPGRGFVTPDNDLSKKSSRVDWLGFGWTPGHRPRCAVPNAELY